MTEILKTIELNRNKGILPVRQDEMDAGKRSMERDKKYWDNL